MSADSPVKSPTVVFNAMDEGGVLFCTRTEIYFGVNEVGAAIWKHLPDDQGSLNPGFEGLVDALQAVYPDVDRASLAEDVRDFVGTLKENDLVLYGGAEEV